MGSVANASHAETGQGVTFLAHIQYQMGRINMLLVIILILNGLHPPGFLDCCTPSWHWGNSTLLDRNASDKLLDGAGRHFVVHNNRYTPPHNSSRKETFLGVVHMRRNVTNN